jgi:hypothetical protein
MISSLAYPFSFKRANRDFGNRRIKRHAKGKCTARAMDDREVK